MERIARGSRIPDRICDFRGGVKSAPVEASTERRKLPERRAQSVEDLVKIRVVFIETLNLFDRVHDRRVMFVVEEPSDLRKRQSRQLAAEIHRDLARKGDRLRV